MTSSPDRRAVVLAGLASAAVAPQASAAPSAVCADAGISELQFRSYIDAFNRGDHHGYTDFYTPDVTLNVVGKMFLRGADEVVAFYSQVRTTARRTIVVDRFDAGPDVIAVMLRSEFVGLEDDPTFVAGPLRKGDRIAIRTFVFYNLEGGRFKRIRSAEFSKTRPTGPGQG